MISLKTVSIEPVAKEDSRARAVYDVGSGGDEGVGGKLRRAAAWLEQERPLLEKALR